jgi:hypothetical protein
MKTRNSKATKWTIITIASVIILSNTPPAQFFLLERYSYQNKDASFTYEEEPGMALDFKVCQKRWKRFKAQNLDNRNQTLYRTFRIKPWQFWEWWQYVAHSDRFALPIVVK